MIVTPAASPAADHGRPAADGVHEPSRPAPRAMVWATAAQAKAMPVQDGGRCSTSTTSTGTSDERTPKAVQPWARLVKQAAW